MYYNTKGEVDKHVEGCLKSVKSETERNLRCFSFAKLYFNVGDYEQARRYLQSYLSVKPASAEGQKLLGKILEKLGKLEAAFEAYRSSLEIDPSQKDILLKVCELLASNEINLDRSGARYFCEKAQSIDPCNPVIFSLKERILTSETNDHSDVTKFLLKELEMRPTDVKLRIRLLKHLLQNNQIKDAYVHAAAIEEKNFSVFVNSLSWYETLTDVLIRYQRSCSKLSWEFWVLLVSALDKFVGLSLDDRSDNIKNCSEYVTTVFNFDQSLTSALENIKACPDRHFVQEFTNHYSAQLCFHIITLIYKQAKKDIIKFKDAFHLSLPLMFAAYNVQPSELQSLWLNQLSEPRRLQVKSWHREAAFRCSQTGHMLLSFAKDRKSTVIEKATQCSTGLWREQLFKTLFVKRDQKLKMTTSYFVSCPQLVDVMIRLPELNDVLKFDEEAQLVHPDSLHHYIWIGLNHKLSRFKCIAFEGLPYSVKNLNKCAAETLNVLDIESFIYCATICSKAQVDDLKNKIYYNAEKPSIMPVVVTDQLGTPNQVKWLSAAYRMYKNEPSADLGDVRLILIKGIEVVRCIGYHGLDVKLLVMLANIFSERSRHLTKQSEIDFNDARADLFWKAALPLLEKLKNNQAISYSQTRLFSYASKEMSLSEVCAHIEKGNLFSAVQLMKKREHERALRMFETLKDPYASFYQAQIYKLMADEQTNQNKENVTSEMRSQNIILLTNAKDCLYLTLDRLREPSVDKKHPLNAQLGTEIEKIERLLSRIDPDCSNRNECDGMSDENLSSAGSTGDHYIPNYSFHQSSFLNGIATPRHESHNMLNSTTTPYRLEPPTRREARPSPERLDAQLRQLVASKDVAISHIIEQNKIMVESHRSLLDELRGFRDAVVNLTATVDDLKIVKHTAEDIRDIKKSIQELKNSVDELQNFRTVTDVIYEMKKELSELKKDSKNKNNHQLSDEDLYVLDEEYGADYNINSNVAAGFNPALYPNYQGRIPANNALPYGAPALYPGMYPLPYPYAGLGLPQPGALPFAPEQQLGADFRSIGQLSQSLNQPQQSFAQPGLSQNVLAPHGLTQNTLGQLGLLNAQVLNQATNLNLLKDHRLDVSLSSSTSTSSVFPPVISQTYPSSSSSMINSAPANNKAAPVNVVITASDPLPTVKSTTSQQVLSVTIPPQHLKGAQTVRSQPHNYQIPMPTTSMSVVSSAPSVFKQSPMPVSTQSILSNVAPPVYSAIANKNTALGFQIEKSLSQSFNAGSANNSSVDLGNKSNVSISSLDEHDPCPDFKPIIPLPDEVPLNTGEEEENVIFCERAKLYRFMNKEWRERGVGYLKILCNPKTGKTRLLMRRDQVLKICANHFVSSDMTLTPMASNDKAYIWAANDYADQEVVLEKFCVKFKTAEEASKFYDAFEKAKKFIKDDDIKVKSVDDSSKVVQPAVSLGGFVFSSTPTFKPKDDVSKDVSSIPKDFAKSTSPFATFTFGAKTPAVPATGFDQKQHAEFKPVQKPADTITPVKLSTPGGTTLPNPDELQAEEFVPTAEFKPVIPLPEVVDVKTGEENADVLFESRAKLLRFDQTSKEWKERGIGVMKLLKEASTIRLLMRRDQVHKVCCNHQLLKNIIFERMAKTPKAVSWFAQDFSEGVLKPELFAIRFKTEEQTDSFLKAIADAQKSLNEGTVVGGDLQGNKGERNEHARVKPNPKEDSEIKDTKSPGWGDKFKPRQSSWKCKTCYIVNDSKDSHCIACETAKSDTVQKSPIGASGAFNFTPTTNTNVFEIKPSNDGFKLVDKNAGWGDAFKPKEGVWSCKHCYIMNDADKQKCIACDSSKDGEADNKKEQKGINLDTPGFKFSFGITPKSSETPTSSDGASKTTVSTTQPMKLFPTGFGDAFKPKVGQWECNQCLVRNDADKLYCLSCENPKDESVPKKDAGGKGISLDTPGQKFNFGIPSTATNKPIGAADHSAATFSFGSHGIKKGEDPSSIANNKSFSFTVGDKSTSKTADSESDLDKSKFVFGSPQKHTFEFTPRSPRTQSGGNGDEESENSYLEEECDNIYFKPVIPLPDKVEVKTGEEQEEVLYCHRAKLYRFVQGEWKERGIGDVKILRHTNTGKLRVVMRREQVLKICLNHVLTPDIEYIAKDDKTWLFSAHDYSEGEINFQQFCMRFKSAEIAREFKVALEKAVQSDSKDKKQDDEQKSDDSDVEIVSETVVSPEEEREAIRLGLPPKFFAYRQLPDCTCELCRKEDEPIETLFKNKATTTADENNQNKADIFGMSTQSSFSFLKSSSNEKDGTEQKAFSFAPGNTQIVSSSPLKELLTKPSAFGSKSATDVSQTTPLFGQFQSPVSKSTPDVITSLSAATDNGSSTANNKSIFSSPFTFTPKSSVFVTPSSSSTNTSAYGSPSGSIFGGTTSASKIFGSSSAANVFATASTTTSNIFGLSPAKSVTSANENNIFSNSTTTSMNVFTPPALVTTTSIFSTPVTSTVGSIFGGAPKITTTSGSLFGAVAPATTATSIFGTAGMKQSQNLFGTFLSHSNENKSMSLFGSPQTTQNEQKQSEPTKDDEVVLKCDSNLSFASLAATNAPDAPPAFGKTGGGEDADSGKNVFAFLGAGAPVFRSANAAKQQQKPEKASSGDEGEGGNDEEYDPHYEPIVPLPAAITVSTGEEEETVLFNERAKLYRFDGSEWKERGVGQIKLLHHPTNNTYRLLLRREQVHKVVLNQLVIPDLNLQPLSTSDKAWMWGGYNYTDDETALEKLAARFKTTEMAKRFYDAVQKAVDAVKEYQQNKSLPSFVQNFGTEDVSDGEDEHAEDVTEEHDDDEEDDLDDDRTVMFSKRCTLSERLESGEWKIVGMGDLQVYYDPEIYGARIAINDDNCHLLSNTIIGMNTEMDLDNNQCTWRAVEWADEALEWRTLRVTLSSEAAASEFYISYQEGVNYAQQCDIVDEIPTEHSEETD